MQETLKIYRRNSAIFGICGGIIGIIAISLIDTIGFIVTIRPYFIGLLVIGCFINAPMLFLPFVVVDNDNLSYKKLSISKFKNVPLNSIKSFKVETNNIYVYYSNGSQEDQCLTIASLNMKDHDKSELINLLNKITASENTQNPH